MAISTKMEVKGLSQYKSQIKSAQQSVKQLDAELKLAAAEYQNTGDKEQYAGKQTELLTKQIAEQEKVVKAQRAALQEMEKNGIDPSSASYQKLQLQMTQAQTKLVTMQSALNGSNGKFKEGTKQVGEYQGALSSINTKVSFDAVINGIDSIGKALETGVRKVARFAKELYKFEAGATVWADELITQSAQTGIGIEDLQRMEYASQLVDADVQDIITGMTKVNKLRQQSQGGWMTVYDGFLNGGLNGIISTSGKSELELFWDVLDVLKQIPSESERDARAMEIFGKSFRELNTLMGETAREDYAQAMEDAPIVSEDGVKQLGKANDALVTMQAEFEKLKTELAVEMAPVFTKVTEALTAMMQEFNAWLQSDEGQEAIQKLKDGFQWLIDNKETVVDAIKAIAVTLATLKVSEGVLKFLQMINGVKGLFGGGKATASAAPAAGGGGGGILSALKGGVATAAKAIAPYLGPVAALSAAGAVGNAMWQNKRNYMLENFGDATAVTGWTQQQRDLAEAYYDNFRLMVQGNDPEAAGRSAKAYEALVESFGGVEDEALKFDQILENLNLDEALPEDLPEELFQDMKDAADAVTAGLTSQMGVFYSAGQAIAAAIQSGVSSAGMPQRGVRGVGGVVSNLYINTMNMANNNVQQLVNAIGNNLNRTRYAYGG